MASNSRRLLRQVNALLDGAKLESGRLRLEPATGNLGTLLEEMVEAAVPLAERRGLRLRAERLDELPDSIFDQHKTEIVAANLLSNALKFTPSGGEVVVRAGMDRETAFFEVADDGPGIPDDQLERIFERFRPRPRAGAAPRRQRHRAQPAGGGLGLPGRAAARSGRRVHRSPPQAAPP
jgi:signal transduction histidine kinase